jgi:hypothetical protein
MKNIAGGWRGAVVGAMVAAMVIASIWVPVLRHEFVAIPAVSASVVQSARTQPADAVLRAVGRQSLAVGTGIDQGDRRGAAESLLAGVLALPGQPPMPVSPRFAPADLDARAPTLALQLASLVAVDVYLDAFEATGERRFVDAARDYIVSFAAYESSVRVTEGFVRNDHALAVRVGVLARFWLHYRHLADADPAVATTLLEQAARCRGYLADSSHFTAATNHGIMQNLAVLQVAAAFPTLPDTDAAIDLAMRRLRLQMPFYLGPEGIVLEHSAGYHAHGLLLIDHVFELARMLGRSLPAEWVEARTRGAAYLAALLRPDGSLPVYGNTAGISAPGRAADPCRDNRLVADLYPVSGYAVWRACDGVPGGPLATFAHTTVVWSYFPGHGHKLADEGSVVFWADGRPWVTNVGYWPYGARGRDDVDGWEGSNALHLIDEPKSGVRETRIAGTARFDAGAFVDLVRQTPTAALRRQVLFLRPATWIVVDSAVSPGALAAAAWTFYPGAELGGGPGGAWELHDAARRLDIALLGGGGPAQTLRGSFDPFGGWTVIGNTPQPTTTLRRAFPADGRLAVAYFAAHGAGDPRTAAVLERGDDADHWRLRVDAPAGPVTIERDAGALRVSSNDQRSDVAILPGPEVGAASARIRTAFATAASEFPRYRAVNRYRWKLTQALLGILLAQELLFLLLARADRFPLRVARGVAVAGWIAAGVWLHGWYFAS